MVNYGNAASGALSGAAAGSAFGPWGAAIGGIAGGASGLFSKGDTKNKINQIDALLPEQKQRLLSMLQQMQGMEGSQGSYGMSQDYLKNMISGQPGAYDQWAAPYNTQFQEQVIPGIAERFAGLGGGMGGGALGSSGFGQALGGAATQYQSNLAGLYAQLQQQAAHSAMNQYNQLGQFGLGTSPFVLGNQPGQVGMFGNAAAGLAQGISGGIGQGIGSGLSAKIASMMNQNKSPENPSSPPTTLPDP